MLFFDIYTNDFYGVYKYLDWGFGFWGLVPPVRGRRAMWGGGSLKYGLWIMYIRAISFL